MRDFARSERANGHSRVFWTALVEGRWSLVERVDSDGQRHYLAYENSPRALAYRALTPVEATVLDQSVQGLQGKYIAYSTGMSDTNVSASLSTAADKLGFRNRYELLRVAATLRAGGNYQVLRGGPRQGRARALQLVKQGLSNKGLRPGAMPA